MRYSFFHSFIAGFILAATLFTMNANAQNQIVLKKKFLSPIKYSYNGKKPLDIYTFSGMDCRPHFKKIISRYPEAFKEIKASYTYNGVALVGSAVMLLGSVLMLSNTLQEAEDVNNGKLTSSSNDSSPLLLVLGGAVVTLVGGMIAHNHLKKGVQIFNAKSKQAADQKGSGLHFQFNPGLVHSSPGLSLFVYWN